MSNDNKTETTFYTHLSPRQVSEALLQQWRQTGHDGALEALEVLKESRYWFDLVQDIEEQGLGWWVEGNFVNTDTDEPLTPLDIAQGLVLLWKHSSKPTLERLPILDEALSWFRMALEIKVKNSAQRMKADVEATKATKIGIEIETNTSKARAQLDLLRADTEAITIATQEAAKAMLELKEASKATKAAQGESIEALQRALDNAKVSRGTTR